MLRKKCLQHTNSEYPLKMLGYESWEEFKETISTLNGNTCLTGQVGIPEPLYSIFRVSVNGSEGKVTYEREGRTILLNCPQDRILEFLEVLKKPGITLKNFVLSE
jgi:hypothetical protein